MKTRLRYYTIVKAKLKSIEKNKDKIKIKVGFEVEYYPKHMFLV